MRTVVDVDLERDDREPVPDPRRERREEEEPEASVLEEAELTAEVEGAHGRGNLTYPAGRKSHAAERSAHA
jgi:hypothetical protein